MFVAVAANELSPDANWFIKVVQRKCGSNENVTDDYDYGHVILAGFKYIKGHFLELVKTTKNSQILKISTWLFKSFEFGNRSKMSDKKLESYLNLNISRTKNGRNKL